jgi:hypothetical protein
MTASRPSSGDVAFGRWLYEALDETFLIKRIPWVDEVAARLQQNRPPDTRREVVVVWLSEMTAFTAPGRYIYISGRLLEYCPGDGALAFVIAHELAHHDLHHLRFFPRWIRGLAGNVVSAVGTFVVRAIERRFYGPERECRADRHGLTLCLAAGFQAGDCLRLFDQLEDRLLDLGDISGVYGPDPESDEELAGDAPLATKVRIWAWQRTRGYLPIRDRRAALERWLAEQ